MTEVAPAISMGLPVKSNGVGTYRPMQSERRRIFMPLKEHVVITGTGRTGTTVLIELLTHLGLDTGFSVDDLASKKDTQARAGLEHDIRSKDCPFIVKSPWFCDHADEVISRDDIVLKHVFIPVRDLNAAAESRRRVVKANVASMPLGKRLKYTVRPRLLAGGLWGTNSRKPGKQEEVLLRKLYGLILALSDNSLPVTFMRYPKILKDCPYLFGKLKPILGDIAYGTFYAAFCKTIRPELINSFNDRDR